MSCKTCQLMIWPVFQIPALLSFDSCVYAMFIPPWIFTLRTGMRIPIISMAGACHCYHKVHLKCWRVPLQAGDVGLGHSYGVVFSPVGREGQVPSSPAILDQTSKDSPV